MIFLQSSPESSAYFVTVFIFVVLAIIIQVLLIRWVFRIDTQVNNQNAMIFLLVKLCEKASVTDGEIEKITKHFKVKGYRKPAKTTNP